MSPRISVIMGMYNCEKTLSAAIDSIINQTFSDWELILCDDGSSDNTYALAKEYRDRYPDKIILLKNKKNRRLAATLNHCLKHASGEFVARMDADDESMPERFEREVKYLDEHPDITCVGTGTVIFDDEGEHGTRFKPEHPVRTGLIHGTPFDHPTIMMRKSAYDALKGYTVSPDTLRAEDVDLWFRFFEKGYKGYVLQEVLYRYRESLGDFKRRSMKAAVGTTRVCLKGYKRLHYPFYYYPYAFKPIAVTALPNGFLAWYHRTKDSRRNG